MSFFQTFVKPENLKIPKLNNQKNNNSFQLR